MRGGGCRVAVVQADARRGRPDLNLERMAGFMAEAARRGASFALFPEMYLTGYEVWPRLGSLSVARRSPVLQRLAGEARRHRIWVAVGYPERRPEGIYNATALVTPAGAILTPYRKVHLFGRERRHFRAGRRYRLFRLPGLTVGLLICYDLEFPEAARALALAGADLIAVSTANMEPFRGAQEVYVRARALENQVFVALANRIGREGPSRFVGGSGVWDPGGRPLVAADREEGVLVATVDAGALRSARRRFCYLAERRPETYRRVVLWRGAADGEEP